MSERTVINTQGFYSWLEQFLKSATYLALTAARTARTSTEPNCVWRRFPSG